MPAEWQFAADGWPVPANPAPAATLTAVFMVDLAGQVVSWGAAAEQLFGRPAARAVGRDICDLLTPADERPTALSPPGDGLEDPSPGRAPGAGNRGDHRHGQEERDEHRATVRDALARIALGNACTSVLPVRCADGAAEEITFRWEPSTGVGARREVLVVAEREGIRGRRLLSEAGTRIGTTLDLASTAREVVALAVPGFADAASVYLPERLIIADEFTWHARDEPLPMRRLATRLGGYTAQASEGLFPPGEVVVFNADTPYVNCMRRGTPERFDSLDNETAERLSGHAAGELLGHLASFLAVPLAARGNVVGCAAFGRRVSRPAFSAADIALAGSLASRAGVSIDNARLYDRERRTAEALQRSLLPGRLAAPPGLDVAHRYIPVGANIVGGDWCDIVPLSGGRAVLIVGDAMGHGPEAAAVMVQLRTAARTLAALELCPEQVLQRLDQMAAAMDAATLATCICAILDPRAGACTLARAGHLPPVLALPDGTATVLDLPAGLPLGLAMATFEAKQVILPRGATLALYTDGLVESRNRPLDEGVRALCAGLSRSGSTTRPLQLTCDAVTQDLRQHGEDDITLVLARLAARQPVD